MLVEAAVTELTRRRGRSPSIKELAERLEWADEQVLEAIDLGTARHALSIDVGAREDDAESNPVIETVGEDDPGYEVVEYGHAIAPVLAELSMKGSIVAAAEGDTQAAERAKSMARPLIDRHRPD